jgi:hypothetical protein
MDLMESPVLFWSEEHTTGAKPNGMAQIEWRTTWSGELQYRVWAACNSMLRATSCRAGGEVITSMGQVRGGVQRKEFIEAI